MLDSRQGNVEGADKIYIRNGARFVGDIQALGIVIEDGCMRERSPLTRIKVGDRGEPASSALYCSDRRNVLDPLGQRRRYAGATHFLGNREVHY